MLNDTQTSNLPGRKTGLLGMAGNAVVKKEEWWEGGIYGGRWGTQLIGGWWAYVKEVPCTPETVDVYATGVEIPCCGDLVSCAIANPPGWDYPMRYECHVSCP